MTPYKVLIVDDEPDIIEIINYNLQKEGFQTFTATNGLDAVKQASIIKPDLILMDVMMPKMDGIEACRSIKANPDCADAFVIFLTARAEEYSEIAGFDAGADDYIAKPIKPRALLSRINAILRRRKIAEEDKKEQRLEILDLVIDRESYLVFQNGVEKALPKKEFELLFLLASRPGKVFTRESILDQVWEESVIVSDRTIDVHIRKLREKLGDNYIKTIKGVGYKFDQ
ncbi:MAG: two-component system alkaline phosphatase synthesis response regulator PhoP [Sphingobacteriales bacterium]|jgi:two-component system alkaline phosphatase synthesis response regulator PhoP